MKLKFTNALSLALILAMLFTSVGVADNLRDDVVVGGNDTITAGGSTTIKYWIQSTGSGTGPGGCDAADGSSATVTINAPSGVSATPSSLTFSACNTSNEANPNNTQSVVFSSSTAGNYSISVSVTDATGTYNTDNALFTLHVNAPPVQNQTINVSPAAPSTAIYGSSFNVAATGGGSGNPVVITTGGSCSGGGNGSALITMISGVGTCTVAYNQAGGPGYNAAPQVTSNTAAQKADATVDVSGFSGPYDGNAHGATGSATGVGGADLSASLSLGASYTDVPGGPANWSFAGGDNYLSENGSVSIVITQVSSSTVVTFEAGPYVYRGTPYTATAAVTGVNLNQSLVVGYTGDCTNVTVADGCTATATFNGDTNHTGSSDSKSITISKAPVTAAAGGGSGTYTGFAQTPADCAVSGAYTGDLTCTNDPASVGPNAGVYPIAPVVAGTGLGNFDITSVPGSYEILKADADCDVDGFTGTYDGQPHGASGTCIGVNGENLSAGLSFDTSYTDYPGGPVHWTFDGGTNYNDQEGNVDIVINKAPVTATAGSGSTTYDGATHSPSACVVSGAYTGDLTCANNPASLGPNAGTTTIVPVVSGTGLGNFAVTLVNGAYTINKANAVCTVTGYNVVFDNSDHTATGSCIGVLGEPLSGLNLSGTTHKLAGTYNDTWTFTDSTGNYNNTVGSVTDKIGTWAPNGFFQPVDMDGVWNTVRNGSTVPLKFEIMAGSTELTDVAVVKSITWAQVTCSGGAEDAIETVATSTSSALLRYDTTAGQFIFNWKTPSGSAVVGKCYRVTMMTIDDNGTTPAFDGSTIVAYFKLK